MTLVLNQKEADELLAMDKKKADSTEYEYPWSGGHLNIPLLSVDHRENFILDITRRRIELSRNKFQTRDREIIILARLDLDDTPHRNPDGEDIPGPHLHVYRENYADKWAYPLDKMFTNPNDCKQTLQEFLRYCNVIDVPIFKQGLFI